jgi:hexosaminidase
MRLKKKGIWIAVCLLAVLHSRAAELNLMPKPSSVVQQEGFLVLELMPSIEIASGDERVQHALARFIRNLSVQTGIPFDRHFPGTPEGLKLLIRCAGTGGRIQAVAEDESYHLTVSRAGIVLTAPNQLGVKHGLETLLQLVEVGALG